ncbi:uncharacterized protein LOC123718000 [Pieris brassicae]|uniref:uncharacterized protein LOC123718000 n=1 Tax=Pieris brassicae TaxID=7116 RepID=UPI001E65FF07|nr:uncharacterized protein LOC123718000 [Pieris brassicae]
MLRTTFSKIKRVCSITFIPRILQGDVKYAAQKKFTKHSMITSQATKSTSSNSGATGSNDFHGSDKKPEDNVQKSTEDNLAEDREKYDRVISKIFPPGDPLYATPTDKEGLEQKIEHIKEVEAGIPITFKEQKESDTTNLYYESEPNNYDTRFDDVANKCLTTSPKKVDEHLLRELGVDHIPDNIDFYPQKPKQSYYSEVLYGKPQVVRYTNETTKTNELQKVNYISDLEVDKSFKAELIQPLIFDSISLCESVGKGSEGDTFDALEDTQLTPIVLNPYASQSFPFHDYVIEEILLENPVEEESMTVTTGVDDVGNNSLIPPNEMDIESDEQNVREKVEGAMSGLAIPGDSTSIDTQPITNMAEKEFDILYTQPTSGPPGDTPGTLHRQPEKVVKQSTSISSKIKEEKPPNTKNSSISDNQDPNDSDNINRISSAQERPDYLLNMQANVFADDATVEDLKEPIFARKTIVSYIEGTYKKPIIEIKIPVYNMKETDQSLEEPTVHFRETGDNSVEQNTVSYVREHSNESASYGRDPAKTPKTQKYSNLERTVSHIEVTEKMPITENTPVLNVRLKPQYEGLLKDKKGVHQTEAANCNLDPNLTATGPIPNMVEKETVTLKELLRRIRERHRLELCREYYNRLTSMTMADACSKPNTLGPNPCKGPDKSPCPPPPKCPSPKKDPCAAKEDPCAPKKEDPCAPKKKDPCAQKDPCARKDPCAQKDPCAKFLNSKIYDTISLFRIYILPDFRNVNFQYRQYSSQVLSTRTLQICALNTPMLNEDTKPVKDIILARDYDPWIPIPSWPIPKKEKRRPFVCPKDGCKLLPSPPFDPAFKDKPCVSFPKKKFSLSELFEHPVVNCKDS